MQFSTFLPFRGKTAKISRTQNFQTAQDLAKKFYTHVSRVSTNIPCEFQQNWRGSLLGGVWFLEIMSLNICCIVALHMRILKWAHFSSNSTPFSFGGRWREGCFRVNPGISIGKWPKNVPRNYIKGRKCEEWEHLGSQF